MRGTCVPPNVTRSTKLRGAKRSTELGFSSTDFRVPENLIFPALHPCIRQNILGKLKKKT